MRLGKHVYLSLAAALGLAVWPATADDLPEILVSRQLLEHHGLAAGDTVQLSPHPDGSLARTFRVTAAYEPVADPFRLTAKRHEARLHLPDLVDLLRVPGDPLAAESVTRLNVGLVDPADARDFSRDLGASTLGLFPRPIRTSSGANMFVVLDRFHLAIAVVTVLGSTAFLLALMIMRVDERRETAGILRLIGFTRPRVLLAGFVEGLIIAVAGAVFGVVLAALLQSAFNAFFQWYYDTSLVFVRVTPAIALRCVALSVPLGILAGVVASWALLRRDVLSLIRR